MASINIDQLAVEIAKGLAEYSQDVVRGVDKSSERVGKETVKKLNLLSPRKYGKYAKSWKVNTEGEHGQPKNRVVYVKAPHYRLTHLLEHGHAKRGGGRVQGIPHIRIAEQEAINEFVGEVELLIRNGG